MTDKKAILYLVHRLPYPPNKGDKIRSFHLLKYLSDRYDIYLATFIDDKNDWQYVDHVKSFCKECKVLELNPLWAKVKSLPALLTNKPLTLPYYQDSSLQQWVDEVIKKQNINTALIYSSSMAQYVEKHNELKRVIDFVDVDSDKWRQYAESKQGLSRWVYQREYRQLTEYENNIASAFDYSFLVSEKESQLLQKNAKASANKIGYFSNGVDLDFFDPTLSLSSPFLADRKNIVFTGAMDYWANVDAVRWFCQKVLPKLQADIAQLHFTIVGSNPTKEVLALAGDSVTVTGRVEDIRPYILFSDLAVAPMQIARGIQNKVLEALALNKTVVMTPAAYEGLVETDALNQLCHGVENDFAECCKSELLRLDESVASWRDYVTQHYSWNSCLQRVNQQLEA